MVRLAYLQDDEAGADVADVDEPVLGEGLGT